MAKLRILYVEDYPVVQQMYVDVLNKNDYEVDIASDGNEALSKAKENEYDLILLDLLLPQMTGIEFLEHYRKLNKSSKVIVLSDFDSPESIKRATELGIDGYWIKVENTPYLLVEKIEELFNPKDSSENTPASSS